MKKILITGANGLLGQHLVAQFADKFELLASSQQDRLCINAPGVAYAKLDISDVGSCKELIGTFRPNIIINAASYTNVDGCEIEKEACWRANVKGVENLAAITRKDMPLLIHISTDYIFDGQDGPYDENATPNPPGYYGKAKLAAENAVRMAGIPYAILRTTVLYGVGVNIKTNFFLWVYKNLAAQNPINVVNDQFNNPTLVDDFVTGIEGLITRGKYGVFHMGGAEYLNRLTFALKIADVFGFPKTLIQPITSRELKQKAPRPMKGGLAIDYARKILGYQPMSLSDALEHLKLKLNPGALQQK